jgi:hypothetical protein
MDQPQALLWERDGLSDRSLKTQQVVAPCVGSSTHRSGFWFTVAVSLTLGRHVCISGASNLADSRLIAVNPWHLRAQIWHTASCVQVDCNAIIIAAIGLGVVWFHAESTQGHEPAHTLGAGVRCIV